MSGHEGYGCKACGRYELVQDRELWPGWACEACGRIYFEDGYFVEDEGPVPHGFGPLRRFVLRREDRSFVTARHERKLDVKAIRMAVAKPGSA